MVAITSPGTRHVSELSVDDHVMVTTLEHDQAHALDGRTYPMAATVTGVASGIVTVSGRDLPSATSHLLTRQTDGTWRYWRQVHDVYPTCLVDVKTYTPAPYYDPPMAGDSGRD
jgi:hypothetical protein